MVTKFPLHQLLMNADVLLIFFNRKLETVSLIFVAIAIIGFLYISIDRNLTLHHNSWTADAVAICCLCHNKFLFYESCVFVMYNFNPQEQNLVSQCLSAATIFPSYNYNLYLSMGGYLHSCTAQRSAALRRASALDLNRRSLSCPRMLLYDHEVNEFMRSRGQYHLTSQVKLGYPTGRLPSLNLSPSA